MKIEEKKIGDLPLKYNNVNENIIGIFFQKVVSL